MTTTKTIRIVTDSTCDLPPDLIEKHGIGVVPAFVNFGGESYADDGVTITRESFYAQLPKLRPLPASAAPPPALAERIIDQAFAGADHLIILTAPAKLSGIFNALRLGSEHLPKDRVTQIDSGTVSLGLGWQVVIAAEVAAQTGDVDEVVRAIQAVREHQTLLAALQTLEYLRAGGRVSWASASIGALLQIKPVLEVKNTEVNSVAKVRTFSRVMDELVEFTRRYAPLDRLAILHADNAAGAEDLRQRLGDIAPEDTRIIQLTPVIGVHTGPGAVGVAPVSRRWRD